MQHQTHDHDVVVSQGAEYYHTSGDQTGLRNDDLMEEYSEKASPPPKRRFYKSKKYWIICSIITVIVVIVVVLLALFVIFPKIAQSLMNKSKLDVTAAGITFVKPDELQNAVYAKRDGDDMNSTFYMNMETDLSNTGPFHAKIKFHNPIQIIYEEKHLGDIYIYDETKIGGGKGKLNAVTPFLIRDQAAFTEFSKTMLAVDEFRWTLKGKLDITALSRTATVDLNKEIVLNGMNGFPNVKIDSFNLPGDDPNGGILVELGTILESPSPIGVQLGTIKLAIGYDGINLGTVSADGITLQKGENKILLKGTLVPHNDTASLDKVGVLFSNYLAGTVSQTSAVGLSCAPDGVNPIGWLSEGFKTVKLNVALGVPEPLKIINSVSMGYLDLKFDPSNPYAPVADAPQVTAGFKMPFGFSLNITDVAQSITLGLDSGKPQPNNFAVMQVPFVPAVSNQTDGTIKFGLSNIAIAGMPGQESTFNDYTYALTSSDNYTFMVAGSATTKANTPIGPLVLSGINFTVPTSLVGLSFLNSSATIINSLDVVGGTAEGLSLAIDVTMFNPSDFSISTGDVVFDMGASGTILGKVALNNLTLARGENKVLAAASFDPKSSDVGQNLLSTFVMGQDNGVDIIGRSDSTNIVSLAAGLSQVSIGSTLPGLQAALIQGSSLIVNEDTLSTGVVGVKVSIANPFSAGLSISKVISAVTFHGFPVGNIDQDIASNPFVIGGKTTAESYPLSMNMNLEPGAVALLLRTLAVQANLDTRPIDAMFTMGGFEIDGQEQLEADPALFEGWDVSKFVMDAMKVLKIDLSLSSTLDIGQYTNDLAFSQAAVAVTTDKSVTGLIPIIGQPIVQQIIDGSVLGFESVMMSEVTESSFKVQMKGSISKSGPIFAAISFPTPLTVTWQGKAIGKVTMAAINAKPLVGASFDVPGVFTVTDTNAMAEFAAYLINNKEFVWDITTDDVSVTALGFTFKKLKLHKIVTLAGAGGFKGAVQVTKFDLPSDDPAGGITLKVDTVITNPSQVGFNLGGVGFSNYFDGVYLGPLLSDGPAIFNPRAASKVPMVGRLVPQDTQEGIIAVTKVFGLYLSGNDSILTVKGESGSGPQGQVSWLTSAFKTLSIEGVILPGPDVVPTLIPSVEMKNMQLDFTKDPWAPPTSSSQVEAQVKNPFGFPLNVVQLNMDVKATYDGHDVATLKVPDSPASTSATGLVTTGFNNIPFQVANKQLFAGFVQLLTLSPSVTFGLEGTSNAIAKTSVGTLMLPGIHFDVDTTLKGFQSFNKKATVKSLKVVGGTAGYVIVDLEVELVNPSDTTITIGDINFDVLLPKFNNARIGMVYMKDTVIPPGAKTYNAVMHLGEKATNPIAVGYMLISYLSNAPVDLIIQGTQTSTTIAPLVPALSSVQLLSSINGIEAGLIKNIRLYGELDNINEGWLNADITLFNPLSTPFTLLSIDAVSTKDIKCDFFGEHNVGPNKPAGLIKHTFASPFVIAPGATVVATGLRAEVGTDLLATASVLLGDKLLNVTQVASVVVGDSFHADAMTYAQNNIPFTAEIPGISDGLPDGLCNADGSLMAAALLSNGTLPESSVVSTTPTTTVVAPQPTTEAPVTTEAPAPATTEAPAPAPTEAPVVTPEEPAAPSEEAITSTV